MIPHMRLPKVAFEMKFADGPIIPGSELKLELSLHPRQRAEVRGGHVELTCTQTYWERVQRYVYSRYGGYYRIQLQRFTELVYQDSAPFIEATELVAQLPIRKQVRFVLPGDVPPTVKGNVVNISWRLRATVDVAKRRDLHQEAELFVSWPEPARAEGVGSRGMAEAESTFDQGAMSLSVPSGPVRAGDVVSGKLRLQVREGLTPRQVRIELERFEMAGYQSRTGVIDRQVLDDNPNLLAGGVTEWRYRLQVPQGPCPTIRTNRSHVEWRLRGIVDQRLKSDPSVVGLLQVHTG